MKLSFLALLLFFGFAVMAEDSTLPNPAPALPPTESSDSQPNPLTGSESTSSSSEASSPAPTPEYSDATANLPTPSNFPPASSAVAEGDKDIYEELEEFQTAEATRKSVDNRREQRTLFLHEGGKYHLGLDYVVGAFSKYDFNPLAQEVKTFSTQGLNLSWAFFPIASLSVGRLGIGLQGGIYMTKYDVAKRHSFDTFGGKVMYEFNYFIGQVLVPHVFYSYERVNVRPYTLNTVIETTGGVARGKTYEAERFDSPAMGGGVYINLNRLEPRVGSYGLVELGVKKFYLAYTLTNRMDRAKSGASHYVGLKFEY